MLDNSQQTEEPIPLANLAQELGTIINFVRKTYPALSYYEVEDMAAEISLRLLERSSRNPHKKVKRAKKALAYVAGDAFRSLHKDSRLKNQNPVMIGIDSDFFEEDDRSCNFVDETSPEDILSFYEESETIIASRKKEKEIKKEVNKAEKLFKKESVEERWKREVWTRKALGTSLIIPPPLSMCRGHLKKYGQ